MHHSCVRTTFNLDDDVLAAVRRHARSRSLPLGRAASELLRRALSADCPTTLVNGLTVFDPGPRSTLVRTAVVRRLLDEDGA